MPLLLMLIACTASMPAPADEPAAPRIVAGHLVCVVDGQLVADDQADTDISGPVWVGVGDGWTIYAPRESCAITLD